MVIVIADGEVHTGESVCLVLGYVGYVTFMVFNTTIMGKMCPAKEEDDTEDVELGTQSKAKGMSMDLESIEVEGGERQRGLGDGKDERSDELQTAYWSATANPKATSWECGI